jgi:thymidine phosphorylase
VPGTARGEGLARAIRLLDSGLAWRKFAAICEAQGGLREPRLAPLEHAVVAMRRGVCTAIDNRRIAQVAKLAGAPRDVTAGIELHVHLGDSVERGAPLYTVHAESRGELEYALSYASRRADIVRVDEQ